MTFPSRAKYLSAQHQISPSTFQTQCAESNWLTFHDPNSDFDKMTRAACPCSARSLVSTHPRAQKGAALLYLHDANACTHRPPCISLFSTTQILLATQPTYPQNNASTFTNTTDKLNVAVATHARARNRR